jgi:hypothetical protein
MFRRAKNIESDPESDPRTELKLKGRIFATNITDIVALSKQGMFQLFEFISFFQLIVFRIIHLPDRVESRLSY